MGTHHLVYLVRLIEVFLVLSTVVLVVLQVYGVYGDALGVGGTLCAHLMQHLRVVLPLTHFTKILIFVFLDHEFPM